MYNVYRNENSISCFLEFLVSLTIVSLYLNTILYLSDLMSRPSVSRPFKGSS